MGKPTGRKKPQQEPSSKSSKHSSSSFDNDTAAFISMSQELKEEGNKLFQKRDYETAMLRFEKALKLLPKSHIDIANLRTNMASCYMQLGVGELPRAINECNLALELAPKYTKALIRRAKCFQSLNRFDLAWKDVSTVLIMEPNNLIALELKDSITKAMEAEGIEPECKREVINKEVVKEESVVARTVKLVYGDDIRSAQLPINCSLMLMREIVRDRYPNLKGVLIKYRDSEGDCVTITSTDELRVAEASSGSGGSLRLYIAEVSPDQEPRYESFDDKKDEKVGSGSGCADAWIVEFAEMFRTQVGSMEMHPEAVEDVVSSEEAQGLFDVASGKFQEMAALALFNLGNVHMSKKEYLKAGVRYEEAVAIKPDFYEGFLALGQQQFEQAKMEGSASEALQLFNKAEDNMETGMQMWEEMEEQRLNGLSKGLDDEASAQSKTMRAQMLILWGSLLYERSLVEFKLGLETWEECLEVAVEKFELAGAPKTDMAVMVKNHCAHQTAQEGLGFKIDEIVQAWHEMYDAKRWLLGVPSSRLQPLLRRPVP